MACHVCFLLQMHWPLHTARIRRQQSFALAIYEQLVKLNFGLSSLVSIAVDYVFFTFHYQLLMFPMATGTCTRVNRWSSCNVSVRASFYNGVRVVKTNNKSSSHCPFVEVWFGYKLYQCWTGKNSKNSIRMPIPLANGQRFGRFIYNYFQSMRGVLYHNSVNMTFISNYCSTIGRSQMCWQSKQ